MIFKTDPTCSICQQEGRAQHQNVDLQVHSARENVCSKDSSTEMQVLHSFQME